MSKWILFACIACVFISATYSSPILNKHERKMETIAKQNTEVTNLISTSTSAAPLATSPATVLQSSTINSADDDDDDEDDDDDDLDLTEDDDDDDDARPAKDDDDDDDDDYELDRILDDILGG